MSYLSSILVEVTVNLEASSKLEDSVGLRIEYLITCLLWQIKDIVIV